MTRVMTRDEILAATAGYKPRHEGFNWHAYAVVERFSADQTAWAERRVLADGKFGPRVVRRGVNPRYRSSLAEALRLTGEPEDGVREEAGNLLVTVGLNIITQLLIGTALTGSTMSNTYGICGVGAGTTAAAVGDTKLTDDGTSAFYQAFDSTYPSQSNGVITGQSTYASANANFAWNEWGWATSTVAVSTSTSATLSSVTTGTETLWNHKVPASSLGTKASGASWVFTTTITLS